MAVLFNLSLSGSAKRRKGREKMLLLRKKLYIFDLISFQYFFVDVWTSFIMFNELTQILWHSRLV